MTHLVAGLGLIIVVWVLSGCQASSETQTLVLRDVTVLPMDRDTAIRHQTLVVAGGLVIQMGPDEEVSVPRGADTVEASAHYLIPGLVDSHVHLRDTTELAAYLAHGVTTVLQLSGPQGAISDLRAVRDRVASGQLLGPRLLLSGRLIDGDPPIFGEAADVVTSPAEGRAIVQSRRAEGYDFVKVYNNVPRDVLSSIVDEAHRLDMIVFGHVPRGEGRAGALEHVLAQAMDVITHGEEYFFSRFYVGIDEALDSGLQPTADTTGMGEAIAATRDAGTIVSPNLSFVRQTRLWLDDPEAIYSDPEFQYLTPRRRDSWRRDNPGLREDVERFDQREKAKAAFLDVLTARLHEAGVPLVAGTDASFAGLYPGSSLHTELEELVRVGLSPFQALQTATIVPGRLIMRIDRSSQPVGTIQLGARADLVLLREDPRADLRALSSITGVVVGGRWVDSATIRALRPTWAGS